jgi:hypothetical protein
MVRRLGNDRLRDGNFLQTHGTGDTYDCGLVPTEIDGID